MIAGAKKISVGNGKKIDSINDINERKIHEFFFFGKFYKMKIYKFYKFHFKNIHIKYQLAKSYLFSMTKFLTNSPIAIEEVNPGDSIPNRFIKDMF